MTEARAPRHLWVIRGDPASTLQRAREGLRGWVEVVEVDGTRPDRRRLGQTVDAAILDLHAGLDPDVLAIAHGWVRAGGALVVRLPEDGRIPPLARLALWPHPRSDVGGNFGARLIRALARWADDPPPWPAPSRRPPEPGPRTDDQRRAVEALRRRWRAGGGLTVVLADRGRGKSAAIGLSIQQPTRLTGPSDVALEEVIRFSSERLEVVRDPRDLALDKPDRAPLVVDEAAGVPIPVLKQILERQDGAPVVVSTTTGGYEGTGQGFRIRVLPWIRQRFRDVEVVELSEPIRWDPGDPLESWVREVTLMDVQLEPAARSDGDPVGAVWATRAELGADEGVLGQVWALLKEAHYRTTPSDLAALLDAPNLRLALLFRGDQVVGVNLLAEEGGWTPDLIEDVRLGKTRIRGHALVDTLVVHGGCPEAGSLRVLRSVRLVIHPELRGQRLADQLVAFSTSLPGFDLDGTLFAARASVVQMRLRQGFQVVRVGVSRGERSGEPSVVMVRARTEGARAMVAALRRQYAGSWPAARRSWLADHRVPLDPELEGLLTADLPDAVPPAPEELNVAVRGWALGPRPLDVVLAQVERWMEGRWHTLPDRERAALRARIGGRPWIEVTREAGYPSVPACMRAIRRAVGGLIEPGAPPRSTPRYLPRR